MCAATTTARRAYDASLALDDANAKTLANKAAALLRKEQYEIFEKSSTKGPGGGLARGARRVSWTRVRQGVVPRGRALTELGDFESAALAFFEGMQIDGDNGELKRGFDEAIRRGRTANKREK